MEEQWPERSTEDKWVIQHPDGTINRTYKTELEAYEKARKLVDAGFETPLKVYRMQLIVILS